MNLSTRHTSAQDYYPFGSLETDRTYSSDNYRFGFNGKENDNEVKGTGNSVDFGARIYDSRLGRWLSVDPLQKEYSYLSPYHFTANNPLIYKDKDGKDHELIINEQDNTIVIKSTFYTDNRRSTKLATEMAMAFNDPEMKYNYVVTNEDGTETIWTVSFEINVKEVSNAQRAADLDDAGNSFEVLGKKDERLKSSNGGYKLGTVGKVVPDRTIIFSNDETTHLQNVYVARGKSKFRASLHEVLHILGASHEAAVLQDDVINKDKISESPLWIGKWTIGAILEYSSFGKIDENKTTDDMSLPRGSKVTVKDENNNEIEAPNMAGKISTNRQQIGQ